MIPSLVLLLSDRCKMLERWLFAHVRRNRLRATIEIKEHRIGPINIHFELVKTDCFPTNMD